MNELEVKGTVRKKVVTVLNSIEKNSFTVFKRVGSGFIN